MNLSVTLLNRSSTDLVGDLPDLEKVDGEVSLRDLEPFMYKEEEESDG